MGSEPRHYDLKCRTCKRVIGISAMPDRGAYECAACQMTRDAIARLRPEDPR